jgi:ubiquinone/menaquinone biosynthesis C-methylase UbiE
MSFHELSYKLHAEQDHTHGKTLSVEMYQGWFDSGTVDLWRHLRMFSLIDPFLEEYNGANWLTVGDGSYGTASIYIRRKGGHALPVDINVSLLQVSREHGLIKDYRKENAESLSFADESYDFCLCKEAYHHFPRPMVALYEMIRVARKGVILIEPADWLPSPMPRRVLQYSKNSLKKLLKRPIPHPDSGNYEPIGNYVYNVSEREVQKGALALSLPTVAFKRFHDVYFEGVEFEKVDQNGELLKKTRRALFKNSVLSRLGLSVQNHIGAVVFKESPTEPLRAKLATTGFTVIDLPKNPHVNGSK